MRSLILLGLAAALLGACAPRPPADPAPRPSATGLVGWYVTENAYFARPGLADEVYRNRMQACDAIEALGLPRGTVFRGPGGKEPDVVWRSAPYRSLADLAPQNRRTLADPAFRAAYSRMEKLIRRFERRRYVVATEQADDVK
jgi:hypothetical protein